MEASGSSDSTSSVKNRQVKRNAYDLFYVLHDTTLSKEFKLELITELLEGDYVDVNFPDDRDGQNTLLHGAVSYGYVDIVKLLLEKGADVSFKNTAGETPLNVAQDRKLIDIVNYIKNIDAASLHEAVVKGDVKTVRILLEKGVDVSSENPAGDTPLYVAVRLGYVDIVKLLLKNGAYLSSKNTAGDTPLHVAVRYGYLDTVKLILEKGADISSKNTAGVTPLHVTRSKVFVEAVNLLENEDVKAKNSTVEVSLHEAVAKGDVKTVIQLLENGADVNAKNATGDTPLHVAASTRTKNRNKVGVDLVKILLEHKAAVNSQNAEGKTALHLAVEQSAKSVVKMLIDNNADVNIRVGGKTPLDLAKEKGNKAIIKMIDLIQHFEDAVADFSPLSYKTSEAKKSSRCTLYQFHLLMCCMLRALRSGYHSFLLGRDVTVAQQFVDIVFKDLTNASNIKKQLFVQVKNKPNNKKGINASDLLSTHQISGFSLLKYFKSYVCTLKAVNTEFAVCTNTFFAFEKQIDCQQNCQLFDTKSNVTLCFTQDEQFYSELFKKPGKCYKLDTDDDTLSNLSKLFTTMIEDEKIYKQEHSDEVNKFMCLDEERKKDCWKTFLGNLAYIVELPADEDVIKTEFKSYVGTITKQDYELIYPDFYNQMNWWSMKPEGTYIKAEDIPKAITSIVTKLENFSVSGISKEYVEVLLSFPFVFNTDVLSKLNQLFSENKILHLISSIESKLTAIQMAHVIKHCYMPKDSNVVNSTLIDCDAANEEKASQCVKSVLFITLSNLLLKDSTDKYIEAFKSHDNNNLLVVHVSSKTHNTSLTAVSNKLLDIVNNDPKKKIVFIAPEDHPLPAMFSDCTRHHVTSVFQDLTPESQNKLLATSVTLQGQSVELSQVIDKDDKDLLDLVPLEDLISDEGMVIGTELPKYHGYDESFYIERSLTHQVHVNEKIFQDISNKKFKDHVVKTKEEFQKFCMTYPGANIHLIREENGRYTWVKSEGKLNALQEYIDRSNSQSCTEDKFLKSVKDQRVVIISDTAGMGKSTILSRISKQIKDKFPGKLVFRVDLNNFCEVLMERKSTKSDKSSAIDFLCDKLIKIKTPFEKELLERVGKVVLLFDGFDEISPDYDDVVIDLIQDIKEVSKAQIWITTRPFIREKLENKLKQFSCSLQPFSKQNQIDFLTKYWAHLYNKNVDLENLKSYASTLVTQLSSSINDKESGFCGIPLQVRMLAECYTDEVTGSSEPDLRKQFQFVDLFKIFFERKYNIFFKDKNNWDDRKPGVFDFLQSLKVSFQEKHRWYACSLLFSEERTRSLFPILSPDQSQVSVVNKIGIVNIINGVPHFVDRSFAEYLCADYVKDLIQEQQSNEIMDFILSELLVSEPYLVFRAFLNGMLVKHKPQNEALISFGKRIKQLDDEDKADDKGHDTVSRVFYCTAEENNQHILEYLCNCLHLQLDILKKLLLCRHTDKQENMLHLAATGGHDNVVQTLLQVSRDTLDQGQSVVRIMLLAGDKDGRTALHMAATGGHNNVVQTLLHVSCIILNEGQGVVRDMLLAGDKDRRTALHLAATGGHDNVAKALLQVTRDILDQGQGVVRDMLLAGDEDGDTALHLAATGGHDNVVQTLLQVSRNILDQGQKVGRDMLLAVGKDGRTVPHLAARGGHDNVVKTLLQVSRDILDQGQGVVRDMLLASKKDGRTALHVAANDGHDNVVQTLLHVSRDILDQGQGVVMDMLLAGDKDGWTSLHLAATGGHDNVVQTLLQTTRDTLGEQTLQRLLAMRDKKGKTALDIVVEQSKTESANVLRSFADKTL